MRVVLLELLWAGRCAVSVASLHHWGRGSSVLQSRSGAWLQHRGVPACTRHPKQRACYRCLHVIFFPFKINSAFYFCVQKHSHAHT